MASLQDIYNYTTDGAKGVLNGRFGKLKDKPWAKKTINEVADRFTTKNLLLDSTAREQFEKDATETGSKNFREHLKSGVLEGQRFNELNEVLDSEIGKTFDPSGNAKKTLDIFKDDLQAQNAIMGALVSNKKLWDRATSGELGKDGLFEESSLKSIVKDPSKRTAEDSIKRTAFLDIMQEIEKQGDKYNVEYLDDLSKAIKSKDQKAIRQAATKAGAKNLPDGVDFMVLLGKLYNDPSGAARDFVKMQGLDPNSAEGQQMAGIVEFVGKLMQSMLPRKDLAVLTRIGHTINQMPGRFQEDGARNFGVPVADGPKTFTAIISGDNRAPGNPYSNPNAKSAEMQKQAQAKIDQGQPTGNGGIKKASLNLRKGEDGRVISKPYNGAAQGDDEPKLETANLDNDSVTVTPTTELHV